MKILLVNPPRFEGMPVCRITRCENIVRESVITPFDLLIMANIFKNKGHEIFFIDANADNIDYFQLSAQIQKIEPEVTISHASQDCFMYDLKTAKIAKLVGSKTVLINWTFKTMVNEVYPDIKEWVDCFVVNHSYMVDIPKLIEDLPKLITTDTKYNFDDLPLPDWDLIKDFKKYYTRVKSLSPYAVTTTSWGCPQHCLFCGYRDTGFRFRTPEHIVDEMEILVDKGVKYIHFYDATFNVSKKRLRDICNEIIRREVKVKWMINARTDNWDYELAKLANRAGLDGVSFGIESFNQKILDECEKGVTVEQNVQAVYNSKNAGIKTNLSIMLGLPSENEENINDIIKYLKITKPNGFFISPYGMCALPNTYWFEEARKEGRKFKKWDKLHEWGHWESFCKYSPKELQEIRKEIYRKVIWSWPYLTSNLRWLITHPADIKMGIEFLWSSVQKFFNDWKYHR